jgi:guanylate kinase
MKKGLLIVFSGVSGVGKGTILSKLMPMEDLQLAYSVSMTTRAPREGEVDGVNYFFVSKKRFLEAVKKGELLEHARFVGNDYGTPKAYVQQMREEGKTRSRYDGYFHGFIMVFPALHRSSQRYGSFRKREV